jgi:membrane protease YdiL (CAAX protease family)
MRDGPILPVTLKNYMEFFQVPSRRWWWALIALASYAVVSFFVMVLYMVIMVLVDPSTLDESAKTTPVSFLSNNLVLAFDIVLCTLVGLIFFRQGFGWMVSVVGRMRWRWLLQCLGIFVLGYVVLTLGEFAVVGADSFGLADMELKPYTWFMIIVILLTTPLQCAGEEFQARALLPKLVCAIVPVRWLGLVLSAILPAAVFAYLHHAQDLWLNVFYFCLALLLWWLAYRTGGIEASIALHVAHNLSSMWMYPFTDFSDIFDRGSGSGSPFLMVYIGYELVLVVLIDAIARRKGVVRLSSPGAVLPEVVKPVGLVTRIDESAVEATVDDLPRMTVDDSSSPRMMGSGFDSSLAIDAPSGPGIPESFTTRVGSLLTMDLAVPYEDRPAHYPRDEDPLIDEEELLMAKKPQSRLSESRAWNTEGEVPELPRWRRWTRLFTGDDPSPGDSFDEDSTAQ